jgi:hypothetical protein
MVKKKLVGRVDVRWATGKSNTGSFGVGHLILDFDFDLIIVFDDNHPSIYSQYRSALSLSVRPVNYTVIRNGA